MDDIELNNSSHQSNPTPHQSSQINFGKNPALKESCHNPDNGIAKLIAELLSNP
jgi:hypothetical protein